MEYVVAAVITAIPASVSAMAAWRSIHKNGKAIGSPNGQGNVVEMLEYLKDWTVRHEGRHDLLEEDFRGRLN